MDRDEDFLREMDVWQQMLDIDEAEAADHQTPADFAGPEPGSCEWFACDEGQRFLQSPQGEDMLQRAFLIQQAGRSYEQIDAESRVWANLGKHDHELNRQQDDAGLRRVHEQLGISEMLRPLEEQIPGLRRGG